MHAEIFGANRESLAGASSMAKMLSALSRFFLGASRPPDDDRVAKLSRGTHDIAAKFPSDWPVISKFKENGFLLQAPDHNVQWLVVHSELPLSLDTDEARLLEEDIRDGAAVAFADQTRKLADRSPNNERLPITEEPGWTPLISAQRVGLPGGPAMMIVHRLTHAIGNETIHGRLLIPTERGVSEVVCQSSDSMSGVRQSLVSLLAGKSADSPIPWEAKSRQTYFDDPRHDQLVPDALSRVRKALT